MVKPEIFSAVQNVFPGGVRQNCAGQKSAFCLELSQFFGRRPFGGSGMETNFRGRRSSRKFFRRCKIFSRVEFAKIVRDKNRHFALSSRNFSDVDLSVGAGWKKIFAGEGQAGNLFGGARFFPGWSSPKLCGTKIGILRGALAIFRTSTFRWERDGTNFRGRRSSRKFFRRHN